MFVIQNHRLYNFVKSAKRFSCLNTFIISSIKQGSSKKNQEWNKQLVVIFTFFIYSG